MANDYYANALFNAARRYCIDHSDLLDVKARSATDDRSEAKIFWAGSDILDGILYEIECAKPSDFSSAGEARIYLQLAGKKAIFRSSSYGGGGKKGEKGYIVYRDPKWTPEERSFVEETRATYISYITNLQLAEAVQAAPVLYRHILGEAKRAQIRKKLAQRWGASPWEHYWHPLWYDEPLPADVLAFQEAWFYAEVGRNTLRTLLFERGIKRIWQIGEHGVGPEYDIDTRLCDFWGVETYWASPDLSWLIYVSHESSITFAGDWLISAIKQHWPNWEQRIYTGYSYEMPPVPPEGY